MSKYQELPQDVLNGMTDRELNEYFKRMHDKVVRDKFAMAALTGIISSREGLFGEYAADAFGIADVMMEERDK